MWPVALLAVLALLGGACGGDDDGAADGGGADGVVTISGSSTVEPITTRVAELFEDVEPDVAVDVDGPGTGDGFQLFCNGDTDISDASRPIKEEEAAACEEVGVEFVEIKVAFDGLSVLTSPDNQLECLSFADLYALVGPESEGVDNWADAQGLADELGSSTTFPDLELDITAPGEESGTYDSFVELALAGVAEERVAAGEISEDEAAVTRPDYASQSDDNAIIAGIEGGEGALGWVGFAFAEEAGDAVQEMAVSDQPGGDCVAPTHETIADGSYPLARPLFIYVSTAAAEENPGVAAFVDFYLGEGIAAVEEVGYVALPDDELLANADAWASRTTGSREG
jgi:phosphate transport system substrate-binding protein